VADSLLEFQLKLGNLSRSLIWWFVIGFALIFAFNSLNQRGEPAEISYSQFVTEVQNELVRAVTITDVTVQGERKNGSKFQVVRYGIQDPKLMDDLINHGVEVRSTPPDRTTFWQQLLLASFPVLLIIGIFALIMRQMQGGGRGGGPISFGRSRARLLPEDQIKTTFADVAGVDEAKEDVQELVEFLRDPTKFQKLGGHIPRGVLMVGQPGTGKTLLAKAIAGEAKVPFFSISGSDFVEMFVGVGASRVRDMFEQAKKQAPCIIFIDEIDAVGRHRGAGLGGGHDEREQTLNQLLVEMDGFEANDGIIVIAATNRPDVLDPALLRPGRFDRQVVVGLPDIRGREQILKVHMRKVSLHDDVEASIIARGTPGFSGADLANLVNEAALLAARAGKGSVDMEEFDRAKDKIMMGAERRSMVMSEKEKRNTAYHEAGHAIVGYTMDEHDPLYKVTIMPRGRALGLTMFLPEEDRYSLSRRAIRSQICGLFGGRIAEQMILGDEGVTTGAANDIERATSLARSMVTKWGLSDSMGPLKYDEEDQEVFLGRSASTKPRTVSSRTAHAIDTEVRRIIDDCYALAENVLNEHKNKLHSMAEALIEYETLVFEQIEDIMQGRRARSPEDCGRGSGSRASASAQPKPKNRTRRAGPTVGRPAEEV